MFSRRKPPRPATSRFHGFESLESRQMMAGNILANFSNGTLTLNEHPGSVGKGQAVWVSQLSNGSVRVSGQLSQEGGSTLINGQQSVVFSHPTNIVANLGGGRDEIKLFSTQVTGKIQILTGDPANSTNDADAVEVFNAKTKGTLEIRTGSGIDNVTVQNSQVGDGIGLDDLTISTGIASAPGQSDLDTLK